MKNVQDTCALRSTVQKILLLKPKAQYLPLLSYEDIEQELWITAWQAKEKAAVEQREVSMSFYWSIVGCKYSNMVRAHFRQKRHPQGLYGEIIPYLTVDVEKSPLSAPFGDSYIESCAMLHEVFENTHMLASVFRKLSTEEVALADKRFAEWSAR